MDGTEMIDAQLEPTAGAQVLEVLRRYWGFDALRPMQGAAVRSSLEGRDSLVVLPTGGGKSLCYQLPAAMRDGVDLVVSPLISLMQDQVDGLRACGYDAVALHSGLSDKELDKAVAGIGEGKYDLVYAAPERLLSYRMRGLLEEANVRAVVIDEAHCVSHWGHDFRPEYRRLRDLRAVVPDASWHAFTATATRRVREDIVEQLGLRDPEVLVGDCDRPNLVYRVMPRTDGNGQLLEAIGRHQGQAVIVYCLSRKDTERTSQWLRDHGVDAQAYHAGMDARTRQRVQDDFMQERRHVIVATVAFGMGVDRSDVRCVVHMTMPKSIEHYQQEAGRAGRDGLDAECVLLYSSADGANWRRLMTRSAVEAGDDGPPEHQLELLGHMQRFCSSMRCRHAALSNYFDQEYAQELCGACDVCLGENEIVKDAGVVAQKVVSCVARLQDRFGASHVIGVLRGSRKKLIMEMGHDGLSVYGLMSSTPAPVLQSYIDQLIDAGALARTQGDRPLVQLTDQSRAFLKGERDVVLRRPRVVQRSGGRKGDTSWEGVDRELFETLRAVRRQLACERELPAYMIFGDQTLREMACVRPSSLTGLLAVKGVGKRKLDEYGQAFLDVLCAHEKSTQHGG